MTLKIGVPSKGRLMEQTFEWFGARGLQMRQTGDAREYAGAVDGIDGVELVLLSAGEIPRELAAGRIHLGVTGSDLLREKLVGWQSHAQDLKPRRVFGAAQVGPALVCSDLADLRRLVKHLAPTWLARQQGSLVCDVERAVAAHPVVDKCHAQGLMRQQEDSRVV